MVEISSWDVWFHSLSLYRGGWENVKVEQKGSQETKKEGEIFYTAQNSKQFINAGKKMANKKLETILPQRQR